MLVTSIFSILHNDFFYVKEKFSHFSDFQFVVCNGFQLNFVVW